jgi:hypothetical protein
MERGANPELQRRSRVTKDWTAGEITAKNTLHL